MPDLDRVLGRVAAPEELWTRVDKATRPAEGRRILWPLAAAAMLLLAVGTLWQFTNADAAVRLQRIALRESRGGEAALDYHTSNCAELRDWLHHNGGFEVPLPEHAEGVELLGARIIQRPGGRIAAIAYRVAGSAATLFVGKRSRHDGAPHGVSMASLGPDLGATTWGMQDQVYTLVADHNGCRLCHAR